MHMFDAFYLHAIRMLFVMYALTCYTHANIALCVHVLESCIYVCPHIYNVI